MADKSKKFFTQKIPQSEYRNLKEKTDEDRVQLNYSLEKVKITTNKEKEKLKINIQEGVYLVIEKLLPESRWESVKNGKLLADIYKQLGV